MSRAYKDQKDVPSSELADRLQSISRSISKGDYDDLVMRIPAEVDRDADIVTSEAGLRIVHFEKELARVIRQRDRLVELHGKLRASFVPNPSKDAPELEEIVKQMAWLVVCRIDELFNPTLTEIAKEAEEAK